MTPTRSPTPRPRRLRIAFVGLSFVVAGVLGLQGGFAQTEAELVVDSTRDAVDVRPGDGACETIVGECTVRAAVQEANALVGPQTIVVPAGTYSLAIPPLNDDLADTGDFDITDSLEIKGAGAGSTIIDGGAPKAGAPLRVRGLDRLFEVLADGGTVAFSGLTFSDGYAAEYGGAIMNNSTATVTITASSLSGNVADKAGGAVDNHLGGVVEVRDSTISNNVSFESGSALNNNRDGALILTNSTVSSNSAADVGLDESVLGAGAIANNAELDARGTITVTGSRITDNAAGGSRSGAAISNDGAGMLVIDGTSFSKNRATVDGGAVFNGAGEVTVTDSTFSENAGKSGGAIYNSTKDGRLTVTDSTFTLNVASARGGAIASGGTGSLSVTGSSFSKNSAEGWGGAIVNDDKGSVAIANSTFTENSALNGGAFGNEGDGLVTVESSTFARNKAFVTSLLAGGEGGGMHSNSSGEIVVTGGAFTQNDARAGGGFGNEGGGQVTITGTRFSANTAEENGGGILIQSGTVRMVDIDVIGNVADAEIEGGGGIAYAGDKLVSVGEAAAIEGSRILDNHAKGQGGGIDSRGDGPLDITTTTIAGNTASMGGGIHHVGDAPLEVTRSTLSENSAENGGGVFTDGDGETSVQNTTVSSNRAAQFGGGLLVSSRLNLSSSTVAGNTAPSGGGINNGGGDLVGDGSVFLANTIVANSPTGGNCVGTMTSLGGNIDSANTCQLRELTDQPGTDPRLGTLADNGGPTQTHSLLADSPAQERAVCTELDPCPPVDQRGVERPRFERSDVGAFESELTPTGGGSDQPCSGRTERPVVADFDSWVAQAAPAANFSGDSILKVKSLAAGNQRALVQFTLPAMPPGCRLESATLRLYSPSATDGRTLEALRVTSEWSETGVTWQNQPGTAGPAATTQSGRELREWDVLALTRDMYAHGDHGFLIRDVVEGEAGEQSFHSTEKGADRPPELVLIFDDPNAPPAPDACPETPQRLFADSDSWVSEGSPTNNFGGDSTLKVKSQLGYDARALVHFPLPALPAACTSIASAVLRLEASSAKEGRTLEALQIASSWSEDGVTWAHQPAVGGRAVAIPSLDGTLEWEVAPHVLDMYTSANHGFLIRDAEEDGVGDEQTLNGRLKLNDAPPELVLVFDDSTPETTIDRGPVSPTKSREATFTFSSDRDDATFECSLDGAAFQACTSPHAVDGLAQGSHTFTVRASRQVRALDPTPANHAWTVAGPPETSVRGPADPSASPSAILTFSSDDPDATFECSLNGAAFEGCASPVEYGNLGDGRHEFRVHAIDRFDNVDPTAAVYAWTVAVPPDTTIDDQPADPSSSASARFAFSGSDNETDPVALVFECRLDEGDWASCASPQGYDALADGAHTFQVRATDRAGNTDMDPASSAWTVDTIAPRTTIESGPSGPSNSSSPAFEFSADEDARFECKLDAGDWAACTSPQGYDALPDGAHTFQVRATDRAGNSEAVATGSTWTIDTLAPTTTIESGPPDPSNDSSPVFELSTDEAGSTFECRLDAGDWTACSSPHTYDAVADGTHHFQVRARDRAGNHDASSAARTWVIDTAAPQTRIDASPSDPSNDSSPDFEFSADEAGSTFECKLDTGDWVSCASRQGYDALADGAHSFQVRATDRAGNTDGDPAGVTWTVDTEAPETRIVSGPADPSRSTTASFTFAGEPGSTFECNLDAGQWVACASSQVYIALVDGAHDFEVRAVDEARNVDASPAFMAWRVDTVAPETSITSAPAAVTSSTSAAFAFTADEAASFECSLDGAPLTVCESPQGLEDGEHSFAVRAVDEAGNVDASPAIHRWRVDTLAPETVIVAAPANPSASAAALFAFSADESALFECSVDGSPFEACVSPRLLAGLTDGEHSFAVRAVDEAGNVDGSPASFEWRVSKVGPETSIDSGPDAVTSSSHASLAFSADEAASFECSLDGAPFTACVSPQEYAGLADGGHSFEVRAVDDAGNADASPARLEWRVDTTAPATAIAGAPSDPSAKAAASFSFAADEPGTFECALDGAEFVACNAPQDYVALAEGEHSFSVRAIDEAGNVDASPASYAWRVDTVAPETTIASGPAGLSASAAASFSFAADEPGSFECSLDGEAFAGCSSPHDYVALADGTHRIAVRAIDEAGNVDASPASYTWRVDTTAPATAIVAAPADLSASAAASFSFAADELTSFECALDGAEFVACSPPQAYEALAEGAHSFSVRAIDEAGNVDASPASYGWRVDTVAPETTIESGPPANTTSRDASFMFSATEDGTTFECSLDDDSFAVCVSPVELSGLSIGSHTFAVRAVDVAGNVDSSPPSHGWIVAEPPDTTAPETVIDSAPDATATTASAEFEFSASELGARFECALDGVAFVACGSPVEYSGLALGAHRFEVRATDGAGNTDTSPAFFEWMVVEPPDVTAPETTIGSGPAASTTSTGASFEFSASELGARFECALDGAPFAACVSPQAYVGLALGAHRFEVSAIDAAGNVDVTPAFFAWTVVAPPDVRAPETALGSGPAAETTSTSAVFTFSASALGASFACSLDGAPFAACVSPQAYAGLSLGSHRFEVRATDAAGNTDATPAVHAWRVVVGSSSCSSITLVAAADSWVDENSTANNFGSDSILKIRSKGPRDNFRALVRFELPAAIPQGCRVGSASLRLFAASATPGRVLHALRVATPWSESLVTWNTQPQTTGGPAATPSGLGARVWDVTAEVQAMFDSTAPHGFLIRDAAENADAEQSFHSREKGESPPQLTITFSSVGG